MLSNLSEYLQRKIDANRERCSQYLTGFHVESPPEISVNNYLRRLATYLKCSKECFVIALIYVDRLMKAKKGLYLNSLTVHRLLLTGITLAVKFFEDDPPSNKVFAHIGGVKN